ncbi:hypothetical protein [Dyadobacter helix]|uniref:hypothetical protein n=1 Tax=Dyadobacter helix TaxID=2822344 RepID=UPI001BFC25EA|nr:hypothetical protein [Dyadobacter sp. CECT 9275]
MRKGLQKYALSFASNKFSISPNQGISEAGYFIYNYSNKIRPAALLNGIIRELDSPDISGGGRLVKKKAPHNGAPAYPIPVRHFSKFGVIFI